jgi:hypothetical protein
MLRHELFPRSNPTLPTPFVGNPTSAVFKKRFLLNPNFKEIRTLQHSICLAGKHGIFVAWKRLHQI